jgi:type I restriction enzyme S subunit
MSTATTHIKTVKKLVPELRFKEFDTEWLIKPLGNECNHITYGLTVRPDFVDVGIPLISAREVKSGEVNVLTAPKISQDEFNKLSDKAKPKKGDVFLTKTGTIGFSARFMLDIPIAITQNIAVIRLSNNERNSANYLIQYFKTQDFYRSAISRVNQSTIMDLQLGDIKKILIPFPVFPEQQKIASFLSAVDEKIQQLTKKKAFLEHYKKGGLQQLFSGQLRFKDENGNPYPDWDEKIFSDLYSFHSTNSLSRDKLNYDAGSVYNIHYGDIHTKFKTAFKLNEAYIPFVNEDVDLSKIKDDLYCKSGDLVMADASEDYADIGKTIELIDLKDKNVLAGLHTFLARPITSKTTVGFFSVLLKSWSMRKQIMVIAQGTKVLSLSTTRVGKLKLKLPVIEEQQKIAIYLSGIDAKIEAVTHQITQTQTFKKGLLQQLFV